MATKEQIQNARDTLKIPNHLAIILDGNGRWAERKHLPRKLGHAQGCETLEQTIRDCNELGIKYLTVYGFSTENWKRSEEEVGALMALFHKYIIKLKKVAMDEGCRVISIGDRSRFSPSLIDALNEIEELTKDLTEMTLVLALNYGGRDEIARATRRMYKAVAGGELDPDTITEQTVSAYLDTAGIPDPDLLVRTSGEIRLSNFLIWQLAYTEIYVTDVLWPDFNMDELIKAVEAFSKRDRRFGGRKK